MTIDWQAIKDQEENKNKHLDSALRRATKLQRLTIKNRTFEQIKSNVVAAVVKRAGCSLKDLIFSPEVIQMKLENSNEQCRGIKSACNVGFHSVKH